jgi:hypothetical protein
MMQTLDEPGLKNQGPSQVTYTTSQADNPPLADAPAYKDENSAYVGGLGGTKQDQNQLGRLEEGFTDDKYRTYKKVDF